MEMTFADAVRETLRILLARDERIFLVGEDIGRYGGAFRITRGFLEEFGPERIIETPISEGSVTGMCIGAALRGMKPILEIMFMDFITLCIDQILNHGAKFPAVFGPQARVPLVIRTPAGGGRGYGPTHSQSLESLLLAIPGIAILAPATPQDACRMLKGAVELDSIAIFVEGKTLYSVRGEVDLDAAPLPPGKARAARTGTDVTVTAYGRMVPAAVEAATILEGEGISCEVIDLRSVKPLDVEAIVASVSKTGKLVTVEESPLTGGTGGEIAGRVFEHAYFSLDAPIKRIAAPDGPVPASVNLERRFIPDAARIAAGIREEFEET